MLEFVKEIWSEIYDYRWLYLSTVLYSFFACFIIKWSWHLRDQVIALPDYGFLAKEPRSMLEIAEEAQASPDAPYNEKLRIEENEEYPSASL